MPIKTIDLDGSIRKEDFTLLIGRNIILKLVEDRKIEELLSRPEVKALLNTEDLCHRSFVEKMNSLLMLLSWSDLEESIPAVIGGAVFMYSYALEHKFVKKPRLVRSRDELKKETANFINAIRKRDQEIVELEKKIKDLNHDLEVTHPSFVFSCPRCNAPLFFMRKETEKRVPTVFGFELKLGEFKGSVRCIFCNNLMTRDNVNRHSVHEIIPAIDEVWRTGLWLEEYVASILRSLEWQTWTRVNILGASGIRHEVNLLAIKKGFMLVGECKTGKVSREDVFTFSTKMADLRSHLGLFGLLGELPEPETREFISKNPAMTLIEKMCELKRKDLIERLQDSIGKI